MTSSEWRKMCVFQTGHGLPQSQCFDQPPETELDQVGSEYEDECEAKKELFGDVIREPLEFECETEANNGGKIPKAGQGHSLCIWC